MGERISLQYFKNTKKLIKFVSKEMYRFSYVKLKDLTTRTFFFHKLRQIFVLKKQLVVSLWIIFKFELFTQICVKKYLNLKFHVWKEILDFFL